jgi:hypothetical protein
VDTDQPDGQQQACGEKRQALVGVQWIHEAPELGPNR